MAERRFEVEISNKTPKGYETATVLELPATWAEFHDALEKARINDARDCHNELTRIEYPGIQRGMIGDNVNLYELNLLAQRLTMLSEDDRMGLDGLLQIESRQHIGPIPLPRLINLTYNTDICTLAPYVSDIQELGALLYESEVLPKEAIALLDTTESGSAFQDALLKVFGQKHQEDYGGVFTSRGYVEPGNAFKEVYNRKEIMPYFNRTGAPIELEVSRKDIRELEETILFLRRRNAFSTIDDVIEKYLDAKKEEFFFVFMRRIIRQLRDMGKHRTSETYAATLNSFMGFRDGKDLLIEEVTAELVCSYEAWLKSRGISMNTVSFYMRILRAVNNRAVEEGIVE